MTSAVQVPLAFSQVAWVVWEPTLQDPGVLADDMVAPFCNVIVEFAPVTRMACEPVPVVETVPVISISALPVTSIR